MLIGLNDLLDDLVPNHIARIQVDELDAHDPGEYVSYNHQSRIHLFREVDLCDVPRDCRTAAEPEAREEHLHLLGARVLCLVEDYERIVESSTAHERERRHLDNPLFHQAMEPVSAEHLVCLLYTSDAADDLLCVDLGGR